MRSKELQKLIDMTPKEINDKVDAHVDKLILANVVGRSEQCKHLEKDLVRNNSAGFKCKCGKEVTYF